MIVASNQAHDAERAADSDTSSVQYLTFMLAGEEYGIEILRVQEIKGWEPATPIPNTPDHLLGVLNLRGAIVPIIDLRKRFALESVEYAATTVVIVVRMVHEHTERTVGLVVDAVADVYRVDASDIQAPPELGDSAYTEFVRGLVTVQDKMVILLEPDHLLDFSELSEHGGALPTAAGIAGAI